MLSLFLVKAFFIAVFVFVYGGDIMADEKMSKAVAMLCEKYEQLGTLPKRSDFTPSEVCFIKQKLGPWTRALEAAGLKEPPAVSAKEKSRAKRERSRQRRKAAKRRLDG